MSDLPPARDGQSSDSKFWFVVSAFANLIGIVSFIVALGGFLIYYFTAIPMLGPVLIAFALGAFFVLMVGHLRVAGNESVLSLGSFSDYAVGEGVTRTRPQPQPKPNIVFLPQRQFVKLLADDFYTFSEIREGSGDVGLVARFRNEPEASCEVDIVRGRIIYFDSERNELGSVSHAPWLGERYNYTKFRVGAERALVIGLLVDRERVPASQGQPSRYVVIRLQGLNTITDNRDGPNLPTGKPVWVRVGGKHMFVKVTLYSGSGVIGKDFWFEFTTGAETTFRSIDTPF